MSQYLRDEALRCFTIDEAAARKINGDLMEIAKKVNDAIANPNENPTKRVLPMYVIRFDGKGFSLHDFEHLMKYFSDATRIERLLFGLQTLENRNSGVGKRVELRFDIANTDNCYLVVEDDDNDWVDFVFTMIKDRIGRYTNRNWIVRNQWTIAAIQLAGVMVGFLFSMWAAVILAPKLKIDNALLFAFIAVFLIFSNAWTFVIGWIGNLLDYCWPNIAFRKPSGIHWLLQAFIATAALSAMTLALSRLANYLFQVFEPLLH